LLLEFPKVKHVACSGFSSFVILEDGKVYFWGSSLLQNTTDPKPILLKLPHPAVTIACGWYHALVLLENGDAMLGGRTEMESWASEIILLVLYLLRCPSRTW
jgi:alpha-tubulin suppressor-like RCC1 family protein